MEIKQIDACTVKYGAIEVTFESIVFEKQITLIQGTNGCGKSTLLKMIAGAFGKPLTNRFRYALELPHFPYDVTVIDLLNAFLKYDDDAQIETQVTLIELFDFTPFLSHKCTELSKGNKMKLNLILTLQANVRLYLLDEPFSGLDGAAKYKLANYIQTIPSQFIITTHLKENLFKEVAGVISL